MTLLARKNMTRQCRMNTLFYMLFKKILFKLCFLPVFFVYLNASRLYQIRLLNVFKCIEQFFSSIQWRKRRFLPDSLPAVDKKYCYRNCYANDFWQIIISSLSSRVNILNEWYIEKYPKYTIRTKLYWTLPELEILLSFWCKWKRYSIL